MMLVDDLVQEIPLTFFGTLFVLLGLYYVSCSYNVMVGMNYRDKVHRSDVFEVFDV